MIVVRAILCCLLICPFAAGCADSGSTPGAGNTATSDGSASQGSTGEVPSVAKVVLEWIVSFAKGVGKFISGSASSLADALAAAWNAFWGDELVNQVLPDSENPLQGKYQGELSCQVDWGRTQDGKGPKNHVSISLSNPMMVRESKSTTKWDLAGEERQRIKSAVDNYLGSP